jgi:hypothetical protein
MRAERLQAASGRLSSRYAAREATILKGISSLKLDSDSLGSQFPNDSAGALVAADRTATT